MYFAIITAKYCIYEYFANIIVLFWPADAFKLCNNIRNASKQNLTRGTDASKQEI
jgi:hypothetical protein